MTATATFHDLQIQKMLHEIFFASKQQFLIKNIYRRIVEEWKLDWFEPMRRDERVCGYAVDTGPLHESAV